MIIKKFVLFIALMLPITSVIAQKKYEVNSPDGTIRVQLSVEEDIRYSISVETIRVQQGLGIPIRMVRGGGWVARISPTD